MRIGGAGHSVGEISRGVILPKFRGDLLESAAVVEWTQAGEIETTVVPASPLDVVAQQVVAMAAMDEWPVDGLAALFRRPHPFRDLGRRSLEAVLDMCCRQSCMNTEWQGSVVTIRQRLKVTSAWRG